MIAALHRGHSSLSRRSYSSALTIFALLAGCGGNVSIDTFVIFRSDAITCTRLFVSAIGVPAPYPVDVEAPWHIESLVITNTAMGCKVGDDKQPVPPKDQVVVADTAKGTILIDDVPVDVPCGADANLTITFPQGGPWVPAPIPFVSGYLSTTLPCDL